MKIVKKIKKKWPSLLNMLRAFYVNNTSKEAISFDNEIDVHVSLTSYGRRIRRLYYTLESLANQQTPPSSITVYLSTKDSSEHTLPSSLKRLQSRGIAFKFVDEDIRSYKKLYYSYLQHFERANPNTALVTADDDVFYASNWLTGLINAFKEHPGTIVSYRAHTIALKKSGQPKPYVEWKKNNNELPDIDQNILAMPTGIAGILYPIDSLNGLAQQKDQFMALCGYADDLWFKCLTLSNGYHVHCISDKILSNPLAVLELSTKRRGLAAYNVYQNGNDIQLKKALNYFQIDFLSFKKP
jgi:hypothetical protein